MKQLLLFLSAFLLTVSAFAQQAFELMTKKPAPGGVVTFEYLPRNTALQGVKEFDATAYLFEGSTPRAVEVPLKQEGGLFRGSVKTTDTTRAVFFAFGKDEKRDNGSYFTPLYDKMGNEVPGANAAISAAYGNWGGLWGMERDGAKASEYNAKEFTNPLSQEKLYDDYLAYLSRSKDETDKSRLKAAVEKMAAKKDMNEQDMTKLRNYYVNLLKDKAQGDAITAQIKEKFPDGAWKRRESLTAFMQAKTLSAKEAVFNDLQKSKASYTKDEQSRIENFAFNLAAMNVDSGNYDAAKKYLALVPDGVNKANMLNNLAWKLSGQGLTKKPLNVDLGLELSKQSLDLLAVEKKNGKDKQAFYTAKQYEKNLESSRHMFGDTYATLLYHKGDVAKAYEYEKAAVDFYKRNVPERNEALVFLTEKLKGAKAAQVELESFFETGKYTTAMKEQLKGIQLAAGKTEAQWNAYVTAIEEKAYNKLKAELAKKMINMPAPTFTLRNLEGKEVSLASLKGKVVVVDFWATWCGPCIASFPGMQMAVNKFKSNPDVVFLFIDTWENDSNRVQKVTDFIAKNKYSFNVLYDEPKAKEGNDFVVITDYKVEGIPTKFVIDRANNIRFKTVGYNSSTDAAVAELTAMIDMAAAESGEPFKKAF